MGKTKSYVDPETMEQQPGYTNPNFHAKSRKVHSMPLSKNQPTAQEIPSAGELGKQMWMRLHRTWVSLRFQFNRRSFGVFQNKVVLKLGLLSMAAYFLFGTEKDVFSMFRNPTAVFAGEGKNTRNERSSSNHFDLGGGGSGKSVSWLGNDAAPISVGGLKEEQALEYIEKYSKVAQTEMQKFGIPASICLAQGLVESRGGLSTLAKRNNNHFGMKCFSKKCAKGHCSNFKDDHHKDFFRIYKNGWESWRAHSEMLASGRYTTLKKYGKDYEKWAYGLKSLGYATDKTYAEKLIGMIERYELYRFDR
jgi:flagellum-specific peptidoglycan hydrolase FlgJ